MNTTHEIEEATKQMIQILLKELSDIDNKIDKVDDIRTKLLKEIMQLGMQYDGVVKQLEILGHDTSTLP